MTPQKAKLIQTFGELLIPLLGYFFWDWNFFFIALFYFMDLFISTAFIPLKLSKIDGYIKEKIVATKYLIWFTLILITIFSIGVLICQKLIPSFQLNKQLIDFVLLEDMGIPQGILLLPLLIYTGYMQYKMEYLLPQKFNSYSVNSLLKKHAIGLYYTLGFIGLGYGIQHLISINELSAVLILIALTTVYSLLYKRV